jgi:hypothetical protein
MLSKSTKQAPLYGYSRAVLLLLFTSGTLSLTAAGPLLVRAGAAAGTLLAPEVDVLDSAAAAAATA